MGTGRNGGIIGVDNVPTASSASGVWTLNEVADHVREQRWPGSLPVTVTNTDSTDDTSNATVYTFSTQSIGAADDDRDVAVAVHWASGSALTLSSATIGGSSATIDVQQGTNGTTINAGCAIIRRTGVTTGTTADVVITLSGSGARCSIDVYRVIAADATLHDTGSAQSNSSPQSDTVNVAARGAVIATAACNDGGTTGTNTWTGVTEDTDRTVENANSAHSSGHDDDMSVETGRTIQADYTGGGTDGLSVVAISLAPG